MVGVLILAVTPTYGENAVQTAADSPLAPLGMVWVPGGKFTMGWDGPEGP